MQFIKSINGNVKCVNFKDITDTKRVEAFGYIYVAEFELLKMHADNNIDLKEYGVSLNLGEFIRDIREFYSSNECNCMLVEIDGFYRGFISTSKDEEKGEYIIALYVDIEYRNKGIATALIKEVIETTKETKATLLVGNFNTDAIKLYEKLGFKYIEDAFIKGMSTYQYTKE